MNGTTVSGPLLDTLPTENGGSRTICLVLSSQDQVLVVNFNTIKILSAERRKFWSLDHGTPWCDLLLCRGSARDGKTYMGSKSWNELWKARHFGNS
jgi:hypothetical protein